MRHINLMLLAISVLPMPVNYAMNYKQEGVDQIDLYSQRLLSSVHTDNNKAAVVRLIKGGANLNIAGANGETPLIRAIKNGAINIVKELINSGVDVNIADDHKRTPLIWAVFHDYWEIVQELIMAGAEINYVDKLNNTALFYSIVYERNELAKFLMSRGADVDIPSYMDNSGIITPIMYAIFQNNKELVRDLLEAGASFYVLGQNERTLFGLAADKPDILEILKASSGELMSDVGMEEDVCSVLVAPQDDIVEHIMRDIDELDSQGYIGLESPLLSNVKLIAKLKEVAARGVVTHVYVDPLHEQHSKLFHIYDEHLKNAGIKVFEISNLHAKRILIAEKKPDKGVVFGSTIFYIGSMNFSDNAPENIELMLRCVDNEGFLENYNEQVAFSFDQHEQQVFSDEIIERQLFHSMHIETNIKKRNFIEELPTCKHSDDIMYIASMTLNDKSFLNQLLRAQKEFFKPIKIILDAKSWQEKRVRYAFLKPLVRAGAEVYIYNKEGQKKTLKDFNILFHIKALLRICNEKCTAVISTGNLTERNKETINYDYWQPCSQKFSNNLKNILDRIMQESEKLELSSFN